MINNNMRYYDYFTFGEENEYGQPQLSPLPQGKIKMSVYLTSQSTQQNINYKDANYLGLTMDSVDDTYVIDYNGERLKVLIVNPFGRYKQVFMNDID